MPRKLRAVHVAQVHIPPDHIGALGYFFGEFVKLPSNQCQLPEGELPRNHAGRFAEELDPPDGAR